MKMKWIACLALVAGVTTQAAFATRGQIDELLSKLIKVGEKSPNFTLVRPDGSKLDLYEASKGKKAIIVNFWHYH